MSHIATINEGYFKFDNFEESGIKRRNIVIYPIIIYTHFMYSLYGVNHYLDRRLSLEIQEYGLQKTMNLQLIKPLTMIDFEYLFYNFTFFQDGKLDLQSLIENYHRELKVRGKKYLRTSSFENDIGRYVSFEETFTPVRETLNRQKENTYYERLFTALNLRLDNPV